MSQGNFKLPSSEIEAADALIASLSEANIDTDDFDRANLVKSGAVVVPPELKVDTRRTLLEKAKLFIAGAFASTRSKTDEKKGIQVEWGEDWTNSLLG